MNRVPRLHPMAGDGEPRPGNRKGTNSRPPDRTGRTRRTAIVLRTPPPVLNGTAANCDPPFGTKRPQVQILSPRPCFRRPEALTRVGEGLSCCPYRSKIPQVPQQIRTFDLLLKWVPQAGVALRWDEEAAGSNLGHPDQCSDIRGRLPDQETATKART